MVEQTNIQETLRKLDRLQSVAPQFGYKPEQVDDFVNRKRAEIVAGQGISLNDIQKDPNLLRIQAMQSAGGKTDNVDPQQKAILDLLQKGGGDLLKAVTPSERGVFAETVQKQGGVEQFKKSAPLTELLSDQEKNATDSKGELLIDIGRAQGAFAELGDTLGGSGPVSGRLIPEAFRTKKGRDAIALSRQVQSMFTKAISGATVTEQEVRRLRDLLPDKNKTETQNRDDLARLATGIQMNQELFELAKRNSLTVTEAYNQFGPQVFEKYGEQFVPATKGQRTTNTQSANTAVLSDDEIAAILGT